MRSPGVRRVLMRVIPPGWVGSRCLFLAHRPGGTVTKSGREIMEILEAFDLTCCAHSSAQLAGTDGKTVARYVALRDTGADPAARERRSRSVDGFADRSGRAVRRRPDRPSVTQFTSTGYTPSP
jgi:hypothetical protein